MASIEIKDAKGKKVGTAELADGVFGIEPNTFVVHQVVRSQMAARRSGTHDSKTRGMVSGGGKKPWRQKGTGRARAGSNGSPLWRGGGRIFPNSPDQNYSQKVNKKMFRAGMAAILSELARQDRIVVVDDLTVDAPKTKLFSQKLKNLGLEGNLLVITDTLTENLYLSSRNLPNVLVLEAQEADPVSLVRFAKVLVTKSAVAKFEEMWG